MQQTGNMKRSSTVVYKHRSKSSTSSAFDSRVKLNSEIGIQEADSATSESSSYEHQQNVYNKQLLKQSPMLMANGQVKQREEEHVEDVEDQSWFRVHCDVFKDKFYWNQYEKTDLTYSKLSPYYRTEVSPGVPMMPNLSRRPLRSGFAASSSSLVRGSQYLSNDIRSRSSSDVSFHSSTRVDQQQTGGYGVDSYSDDEGDFVRRRWGADINEQHSFSLVTTVYSFVLRVITSIYTAMSRVTNVLFSRRSVVTTDIYRGYSTPQNRHQQHASSLRWGQWLYRLLCHQLLTDSWLLKSMRSSTHTTQREAGRQSDHTRFMFWLFFMLPLALLAGWWAVGEYPVLSSKPSQLLSMLPHIGSQHSHKEEIRLPVISMSDSSKKEYLDLKSQMASLVEQVEALKNQILNQHLEMESQQAKFQSVEKTVELFSDNLMESKSKDVNIDSVLQHMQMSLHSLTGKVQRLSRCCDRPALVPAAAVQDHVLKFLREVFSSEGVHNYADIHAWLKSMFVAKDVLEAVLANVSSAVHSNVSQELAHSAEIIMEVVAERIVQAKLEQHRSAFLATAANSMAAATGDGGLTYDQVKQIVHEALSIYDADKTGLVDYALESSGGTVLSTRCTENFNTQSATLYMFNIRWWLPWFSVGTSPRMAIQPHMSPGECWAFAGAQGFLVIQLSREVHVSGFTLEHIPKSLSPNGHIDSAPKKFSVWGLQHENDEEPLLLGSYSFMQNTSNLQYFKVQQEERRPFRIVELKVMSNHGHPNYTCIYRFRVHGTPVKK